MAAQSKLIQNIAGSTTKSNIAKVGMRIFIKYVFRNTVF